MSIKDDIRTDLKNFMRSKDTYALEIVRILLADIKNAEIDAKAELDDDGVVKVAKSLIKKHNDSLDEAKTANRNDLAEKESRYLEVLEKYMPAQLTDGQIKEVIAAVIKEGGYNSPQAFGAVIKQTLAKVGAGADGKRISALVKEALNGV
jgi:uncharacterized protein YqeY